MQKKILTAAISAVLLSAGSVQAAVLDLTVATPAPFTYVESLVSANASTVTSGADCAIATTDILYGVNSSSLADRSVRIELDGGTFGTTAPAGTAAGVAPLQVLPVAGGNAGDTFVVFQVDTTLAHVAAATLRIDLGSVVFDAGSTSVGIEYSVHVEADNAANDVDPLFSQSHPGVLTLGSGITSGVDDKVSAEIDPANDVAFVAGTPLATTVLSELSLLIAPAAICDNVGVVALFDSNQGNLEVTGDFSAYTTAPGAVFLAATCTGGVGGVPTAPIIPATTITATTATFDAPVAPPILPGNIGATPELCVTADGTNPIVAGSYECTTTYAFVGGSEITLDPVACGEIGYAGSSDRVNYGLSPEGVYKQWFRISNPSNTSGDVFITLVNDDGISTTFPLSDATGAATPELAAGSSTAPLSVDILNVAGEAANGLFTGIGSKLRVIVRGNFGDDLDNAAGGTFGDANSTDGIIIEATAADKSGDGFVIME